MLVKLTFFESLEAHFLSKNHMILCLWVSKNGHFCKNIFSKWILIFSEKMTSEIDFPYGGNLKSILEAGIRAVTLATEPHYGEYFFCYV